MNSVLPPVRDILGSQVYRLTLSHSIIGKFVSEIAEFITLDLSVRCDAPSGSIGVLIFGDTDGGVGTICFRNLQNGIFGLQTGNKQGLRIVFAILLFSVVTYYM